MSDNENEEYEVESIREARVEAASRSKKAKLIWKYLVRWKNYTAGDDTWEPIDSFVGSEDIVQAFWERAQTGGRDITDMSQFNAGETFRPVGPPRRPKRKSVTDVPTTEPQTFSEERPPTSETGTKTSEKRRRVSPEATETTETPNRPTKRTRGNGAQHAQSSSPAQQKTKPATEQAKRMQTRKDKAPTTPTLPKQKKRRSPSIEIIPDSDEEMNASVIYLSPPKPSTAAPVDSPIVVNDGPSTTGNLDEQPSSKVPLHRARKESPLVKRVDFLEPGVMAGAISTKARAVELANAVPSSSSSKPAPKRVRPGPGRSSAGLMKSSLLTAEKGTLKTIKGKYSKQKMDGSSTAKDSAVPVDQMDISTEVDNTTPQALPTAEELLELAGLDPNAAESLSDFEDIVEIQNPVIPALEQMTSSTEAATSLKESRSHVTDHLNMFGGNVPIKPSVTSSASFTRSTIFGVLTMGSESTPKLDQLDQKSSRLFLNLDASLSIPILLTAASLPDSFNSKIGSKGTPGKFYRTEAALTLLGTIRASGTSAVVMVDEDEASNEEKDHFARFSARLEDGDLFVAVAGVQILVFCSTSNTLLSQRLNAPPALLNQPSKILVSQVDVENYSGYADATADADERRWAQYVAAN